MHRLGTDEMVSSFPENRQNFSQYVNTRPLTINNIVNTTDIDNIIDRVLMSMVCLGNRNPNSFICSFMQ